MVPIFTMNTNKIQHKTGLFIGVTLETFRPSGLSSIFKSWLWINFVDASYYFGRFAKFHLKKRNIKNWKEVLTKSLNVDFVLLSKGSLSARASYWETKCVVDFKANMERFSALSLSVSLMYLSFLLFCVDTWQIFLTKTAHVS